MVNQLVSNPGLESSNRSPKSVNRDLNVITEIHKEHVVRKIHINLITLLMLLSIFKFLFYLFNYTNPPKIICGKTALIYYYESITMYLYSKACNEWSPMEEIKKIKRLFHWTLPQSLYMYTPVSTCLIYNIK